MNVLQTIGGFTALSGGTSTCTYDLLNAIHQAGGNVDLLTPASNSPDAPLMGHGEEWIKAVDCDYITPYAYSGNMRRLLRGSEYDIYHTNGLWMYVNHATCSIARAKHKPYIITPHGMLYPQALARSSWKKKLMMAAGFRNDLAKADVLHATCAPEAEHLRNLGLSNPIAVIPNAAPIPDFVSEIKPNREQPRIGFLGRLHPRKQVDILIRALSKANNAETVLLIMGEGDPQYVNSLKQLVADLGLEERVIFKGFVKGKEKFELLASLRALCVPSDFENFGMIVTEALSVGTPVIASKGTPWESLVEEQCGWWIEATVEDFTAAINEALGLNPEQLIEISHRARNLVESQFAPSVVASQMLQLYSWLLGNGERPEFVYTN